MSEQSLQDVRAEIIATVNKLSQEDLIKLKELLKDL